MMPFIITAAWLQGMDSVDSDYDFLFCYTPNYVTGGGGGGGGVLESGLEVFSDAKVAAFPHELENTENLCCS